MNSITIQNISQDVQRKWHWFVALGLVFVIGGLFAITMPLASSIAVGVFLAIVLLIAGAMQIWQSFSVQGWSGFLWQLIVGIVVLLGGVAIYAWPTTGALALTIVIAGVFIAKGVFEIILGLHLRPRDGWGWIVAAGIVAVIVGVMIISKFPFSGLWVPGTLAGISLMFTGGSYIALGLAARRIA